MTELWPHLTRDLAGLTGLIRKNPEDFAVDEVPAYVPSGRGDHLFVRFEKTDLTTREAVRRLAATLGADVRKASWAGLKDRRAVTTQWASFEGITPAAAPPGLQADGVRVLESALHEHKLRTGHLRANRFRIHVRDVPSERMADVLEAVVALQRTGVPNYYEAQRFGRDGSNLARARRWLVEGGRPPRDRFARKWDVSVLQSWVFNQVLAERVSDGSFGRALPGDLMRREDTGGMFVSDGTDEAQVRMDRWEISPTGPMVGPRMRWPEGEALEREQRAVAGAGLTDETLKRFGKLGRGTRRPLRVATGELQCTRTENGVELVFELPSGAYATAVLREIFKDGLRVHSPDEASEVASEVASA